MDGKVKHLACLCNCSTKLPRCISKESRRAGSEEGRKGGREEGRKGGREEGGEEILEDTHKRLLEYMGEEYHNISKGVYIDEVGGAY